MNKKLLVALAALLRIKLDVIETDLSKEDGDDSLVTEFSGKHEVFTTEDLQTKLDNANKQYLTDAKFDINEVPKELYDKITGAVLEKREKQIAEEHGITDYKGLQDLVSKAVAAAKSKGADGNESDKVKELEVKVITLQGNLKTSEAEKDTAVKKVRDEHETELVTRDLTSALTLLPLDYEEENIGKQRELLTNAFGNTHKVVRKNGNTVVLDGKEQPILNKLGEPMPITDVLTNFATDYGFKFKKEDEGGRGSGSSEPKNNTVLKGQTFTEVLAARDVRQNTEEADKLYVEWGAANKE